ncbi:MAG: hypothetical protein KatS3mg031_1041 [Chitinophagales bacterium]|nr:MAG: hypothetical protein KatS3mg031_1041 [Chitinophagales bacterium]
MKKEIILFILIVVGISACNWSKNEKPDRSDAADGNVPPPVASHSSGIPVEITYTVTELEGGFFGYSFFFDGNPVYSFPSNAIDSNIKGFKTREDAEKVAQIALKKLRAGQLPPVVTDEELRAAGVEH